VGNCPLCLSHHVINYSQDKSRTYNICQDCELIFVPRDQILGPELEKQRYDTHNNDDQDVLYQDYLGKIVSSVLTKVSENKLGLDFGCGRTKLLATLFNHKAVAVDSFDLYYFPDENIWDKKFDFIILSEVIEHLREPYKELSKLRSMLMPNGYLFIKTKIHLNQKDRFDKWFYKRDFTHVQFFCPASLQKLAQEFSLEFPEIIGEDLYSFKVASN
jgi:SAM-dependent methyltransferase